MGSSRSSKVVESGSLQQGIAEDRTKISPSDCPWRVYDEEPCEPYGMMFHHFHKKGAKPGGQGSIDADDFEKMLDFLESKQKGRILGASEFEKRWLNNTLEPYHICLSFDDGTLGQYEVAVPAMEKRGLTGFFFVYTDIEDPNALGTGLGPKFEPMETMRYFQCQCYNTLDDYVKDFIEVATEDLWKSNAEKFPTKDDVKTLLESDSVKVEFRKHHTFYTALDRQYRYVRDILLTPAKLEEINILMMERKGFEGVEALKKSPAPTAGDTANLDLASIQKDLASKIWICAPNLQKMRDSGHTIGLHSAGHPPNLHTMTLDECRKEYGRNFDFLKKNLGISATAMSHPLGNWCADSLQALTELGVLVGFSTKNTKGLTNFEIPRIDHATCMKKVKTWLETIPKPLDSSAFRKPRITVFTSNQRRHIGFIRKLSTVASSLHAVQECSTVCPGVKKSMVYDKSDTMKEYFKHVLDAENYIFPESSGDLFTPSNVSTFSIVMGDLNDVSREVLAPALQADIYVVFGTSFIKGWLIDFLVQNKCLNLHLGVSPYMRGASCNFWALYKNRPELVGATVHLITKGLDSGPMLWHAKPAAYGDYRNSFEYTMRAVDVVQNSVVHYIAKDSIKNFEAVKQDKKLEVFYSRYTDFTDEVAAEFLEREDDLEGIRKAIVNQDGSLFYNLYEE